MSFCMSNCKDVQKDMYFVEFNLLIMCESSVHCWVLCVSLKEKHYNENLNLDDPTLRKF